MVWVLASPDRPGRPAPSAPAGLRHQLYGVDGTVWHLSDDAGPLVLGTEGLLGLMEAPVERYTSSSPALAGSWWRGDRTTERPVRWPLHVLGDQSTWLAEARALFRALSRRHEATWRVVFPDGSARSLQVRLVGTGPHQFDVDPTVVAAETFTVDLVAEDPYWRGDPVGEIWADTPDDPFFGGPGEGGGPPFVLSSGQQLATAQVTNPGDTAVWPVWTVAAASTVTSVVIGVGGDRVVVGTTLTAGQVMVVDTDPRRQSVTVDGERRRGALTVPGFAEIPPGVTADLDLSMDGEGSVRLQIVPRYERCL